MKKLLKEVLHLQGIFVKPSPSIIINVSVQLERNLILILSFSNTILMMEKEMMNAVKIRKQMKTITIMMYYIFFSRKLNLGLKMDASI
jgi:hypothetical protein